MPVAFRGDSTIMMVGRLNGLWHVYFSGGGGAQVEVLRQDPGQDPINFLPRDLAISLRILTGSWCDLVQESDKILFMIPMGSCSVSLEFTAKNLTAVFLMYILPAIKIRFIWYISI